MSGCGPHALPRAGARRRRAFRSWRERRPQGCRLRFRAALPAWLCVWLVGQSAGADDVQRWIRQLGADGFAERQAAHERLLQRGPELLPQLRAAAVQGDPEIRLRAAQLADRLREAQFEVLLQHLTSHPDEPAPDGLPAWGRYAAIAGDDVAARSLYAGMVRLAPDVMLQLEVDDERLIAALQALLQTQFSPVPRSWAAPSAEFLPERLGLLLFPAIEREAVDPTVMVKLLGEWLGPALMAGEADESAEPLRRLAGAWVAAPHTAPRSKRMELARLFGLPEGVAPAREALLESSPDTKPETVNLIGAPQAAEQQEAVLLLARFGGIEHVPDLEPLLSDGTEINIYQRRREIKFQTRLQDLALVALLHLTGQKPADYGFAVELTENAQTVYSAQTVGFVTEEARQAALAQWQRWRAVHLQARRFPPLEAVEGVTL